MMDNLKDFVDNNRGFTILIVIVLVLFLLNIYMNRNESMDSSTAVVPAASATSAPTTSASDDITSKLMDPTVWAIDDVVEDAHISISDIAKGNSDDFIVKNLTLDQVMEVKKGYNSKPFYVTCALPAVDSDGKKIMKEYVLAHMTANECRYENDPCAVGRSRPILVEKGIFFKTIEQNPEAYTAHFYVNRVSDTQFGLGCEGAKGVLSQGPNIRDGTKQMCFDYKNEVVKEGRLFELENWGGGYLLKFAMPPKNANDPVKYFYVTSCLDNQTNCLPTEHHKRLCITESKQLAIPLLFTRFSRKSFAKCATHCNALFEDQSNTYKKNVIDRIMKIVNDNKQ